MKLKHVLVSLLLTSIFTLISCSKSSKSTIASDALLKLIPPDAIAFLFSDYSLPASKKLRSTPAMKNSAAQIEEQVAKLKEIDPKLAEAMQSVMKAIPGNITSADSSIEKMLAYYRVAPKGSESPADVAVRVSFSNETDPTQLITNIKKGVLGGITATEIEGGLKIEATQNPASPIVFYLCNTPNIIVASINKSSCTSLLAPPPSEGTIPSLIVGMPKDSITDTTTLIGGISITDLLSHPLESEIPVEIPKETPLKAAYFSSGFNGALTSSLDVFLTEGNPRVESVVNQFKEFSGKKIEHRTPDSAPFSFSLHLPSGLSADLNALLSLAAPTLSTASLTSLACGLFENDEGSIPGIGCAFESKDGEVLAAALKAQAAEMIRSQTGMSATWEESDADGIKSATYMTPLGFGISLGSKGGTTLIGTNAHANSEMKHGKTKTHPLSASAPLIGHLNGNALYELIKGALESAKLFGVDTSQYDESFKGLMSYSDIYYSGEVTGNRINFRAVAHFKE
jgi:hypothetical protein